MTRYKNIAVTAALAAIMAVNTAPRVAEAATLLDILRGGPGAGVQKRQSGSSTFFGRKRPGTSAATADPEVVPRVSGPRYYSYKAEATRSIALAAAGTAQSAEAVIDPVTGPDRFLAEAKMRAPDEIATAVESYYNDHRPPIWVTEDGISERARSAMEAFAAADAVGLNPDDYAVDLPGEIADPADPDKRMRDLMQFELSMSVKALTYVSDTVRGRIDPNKLSGYHDIKRKTVNLKPILNMLRLSPDVGAYLRSRTPSSPQFQALQAELARLRAEDSEVGITVAIAPGTLLKPGASSAELANVRFCHQEASVTRAADRTCGTIGQLRRNA